MTFRKVHLPACHILILNRDLQVTNDKIQILEHDFSSGLESTGWRNPTHGFCEEDPQETACISWETDLVDYSPFVSYPSLGSMSIFERNW